MAHFASRAEQFEQALLAIDRVGAQQILQRALQESDQLETIDRILTPALEHIGAQWEAGQVALSQVYMSGVICEELISEAGIQPDIIGIAGEPKTLLIVDDSQENRQFLKDILAPLGSTLLEAGNGSEAIALTQAHQPDAVLMDLMLPGIDGCEAVRRIHSRPELREVVMLAVSADASLKTREQALAAGCRDFLPKPVVIDDVLRSLHQHLLVDWIYANRPDRRERQNGTKPERESALPSQAQLSALNELAVIGDIFGIHDFLNDLEHAAPQYAGFVSTIRDLAKSFQIAKIQEMLQSSMTSSA